MRAAAGKDDINKNINNTNRIGSDPAWRCVGCIFHTLREILYIKNVILSIK